MKLCAVLGTHPSNTPGGAEFQAQLICSELAERGHKTYYIAYDSGEEYVDEHDGVTVFGLNTSNRFLRIISKVRNLNPDVVYLRLFADLPLSLALKWFTDAHIVFNVSHDAQCLPRFQTFPGKSDESLVESVYRRTKLAFRRSFLSVPDTIFVQTEYQQRLLQENWNRKGILTGNGHPVPDGEPTKHSPPVVLWLASIKEWKQPHVFIDLAAACTDLPCEFWMVGQRTNESLAEEVVERAESIPNLKYLGPCTIEESNNYFEQASVFVNTSKQEGYPNTFIQSWLRKTPVVSLNADPIDQSEVYHTGYYGLEDADEIVDRVRDLIETPDHRDKLAEEAYTYACEHNDIRKVVDRILKGLPDNVID
jgi:glycosyltransferase involved in cell wall biosynthesis